ncbi:hypothetical protein BCR42DRAFT_492649 [Absidia repens]|uniref:Uncharacterized protein n=1 Tax=Absidia repens TaxID=90262 RepID=A0A1X2ICI3_9FUNG|nr:hypothetical protein BCR42DRAFT_492649 [Absidia repens]
MRNLKGMNKARDHRMLIIIPFPWRLTVSDGVSIEVHRSHKLVEDYQTSHSTSPKSPVYNLVHLPMSLTLCHPLNADVEFIVDDEHKDEVDVVERWRFTIFNCRKNVPQMRCQFCTERNLILLLSKKILIGVPVDDITPHHILNFITDEVDPEYVNIIGAWSVA